MYSLTFQGLRRPSWIRPQYSVSLRWVTFPRHLLLCLQDGESYFYWEGSRTQWENNGRKVMGQTEFLSPFCSWWLKRSQATPTNWPVKLLEPPPPSPIPQPWQASFHRFVQNSHLSYLAKCKPSTMMENLGCHFPRASRGVSLGFPGG